MNINNKVEKIMTTDLTAVKENEPVYKLKDLFDRRLMHHVLVEDRMGELLGIVSTEDMARTAYFPYREEQLLAKHIMSVSPFSVTKDTSIKTVINHFLDNRFRAIPVVNENDVLIGIVTPYDIMSMVISEFEKEELKADKN
jgi:CBS domain-containing protein